MFHSTYQESQESLIFKRWGSIKIIDTGLKIIKRCHYYDDLKMRVLYQIYFRRCAMSNIILIIKFFTMKTTVLKTCIEIPDEQIYNRT
jgi:hypothetical protein